MARRNDHTPAELSDEVIQRVLDFLQTAPASQLSLRKLAKMVGYSPGTLINHFGSYAHLILAANARTLDQIGELLLEAVKQSQAPSTQLTLFAHRYWQFAQDHPYQWQILFEHHLEPDDEVPTWQINRIDRLFKLIERCLRELKPQVGEQDCQKASRTLWASVHGICALSLDNKLFAASTLEAGSMIDSLLKHFLASWAQDASPNGGLA